MTHLPFHFPASLFAIVLSAVSAMSTSALAAQNPVEPRKPVGVAGAPDVQPDLSLVTQQIIGRTNAFRKQENRRPVEADPQLTRSHERCRPAQLALLPPGDESEVPPIKPESGDRFVVSRENGSLAIRKDR